MLILPTIKALCNKKGISLSALERELGISHGAVSSWDTSSPTIKNLAPVADYLGVTVDYLIKGGSNGTDER